MTKRGTKKKPGWPRGVPRGEYIGKPRGRPKKIITTTVESVVFENGVEVVKRSPGKKKRGWPLGVPRGVYTGKGRGRPKKSATPKRKPGRPPKLKQPEFEPEPRTAVEVTVSKKRSRGRPPKVSGKHGWPLGMPRGVYTGKPRGRPKKIVMTAVERVVFEDGVKVVKRSPEKKCGWPLGVPRGVYTGKPRGRPKKIGTPKRKPGRPSKFKQPEPQTVAEVPVSRKRPRGRPPKGTGEGVVGVEVYGLVKRRGRPPMKQNQSHPDKLQVVEGVQPLKVEVERAVPENGVKRSPGRPKKKKRGWPPGVPHGVPREKNSVFVEDTSEQGKEMASEELQLEEMEPHVSDQSAPNVFNQTRMDWDPPSEAGS